MIMESQMRPHVHVLYIMLTMSIDVYNAQKMRPHVNVLCIMLTMYMHLDMKIMVKAKCDIM